jgi:hypothetical protein
MLLYLVKLISNKLLILVNVSNGPFHASIFPALDCLEHVFLGACALGTAN